MKVLLSWLKEFVDLKITPAQISEILTQGGLEVEGVTRSTPGFSKVVVASVLGTTPHPNADKLCIARVTDGVETYQVVCGAPNCRGGMKTALALIGAELTEGGNKTFKVKRSKIRGEESFGMLCSGKELGLSEEGEGILEFAEQMKEGIDLAELYSDVVFEIALTPNLSHASSIVGVARELAARLKEKLRWPQEVKLNETSPNIEPLVQVVVEDKENCPRYAARLLEGVKVAPSPDWLKKRLEAVSIRPINNVVDVTNYILLELGHPLHAFDFDKVEGHKIVVRQAREGEGLETLDGLQRKLEPGMLLICDENKPIALAGVMGGSHTEVTETTSRILLEAAYFAPSSIRKTAKKLQLFTDAVRRFEKGVDPNEVEEALDRAALLIQSIAGGEIRYGRKDVKTHDFLPQTLSCRLSRINQILGIRLSANEVETIFTSLGFRVSFDGKDTFSVAVPTFRVDITSEIDLVEEAARLWGYDNIPRAPSYFQATQMPHAPSYLFEKEVKDKLIAEGLQEFINCDLIGPTLLHAAYGTKTAPSESIQVLNPVSVEQSVLRTSLLPGLLQTVKHNYDRECHNIAGFEVGRIHFKEGDKFKEQTLLSLILSGKSSPTPFDPKPHDFDFRDMKGMIENIFRALCIENYSLHRSHIETLHPGRQASLFVGGLELGSFGEVHPAILRRLDVPQKLLYAEMNLFDLFQVQTKSIKMKPLAQFPASERDWTVKLLEKAPVGQVISSIKASPSSILEEIHLIDIYRSPTLGLEVKNVTFRFLYRDKNKTLEQETIDREHARLTEAALQLITGCIPPS